jgi:hypothetical protein
VMSGARASDISDAAGSVTCLVLSQARPRSNAGRVATQAKCSVDNRSNVFIRKAALILKIIHLRSLLTSCSLPTKFAYRCRRLSSPLYDLSSPRDRPIRKPMARFPFGSGIVVPLTWL